MKREDIVQSIDFEITGEISWPNKELENAMVAAYNKALEDAAKFADWDLPATEIGSRILENLKIV